MRHTHSGLVSHTIGAPGKQLPGAAIAGLSHSARHRGAGQEFGSTIRYGAEWLLASTHTQPVCFTHHNSAQSRVPNWAGPPGSLYFQVNVISSFSLVPAIHTHHSGLNLGWDIASRRQGSNSAVAACEKSSCLTSGFLSSPRGAAGGCWLVGPSKLLCGATGCSAGGRWLWWPGGDCASGLAWSAWPGGIRLPSPSRGRPSSSSARLHCATECPQWFSF